MLLTPLVPTPASCSVESRPLWIVTLEPPLRDTPAPPVEISPPVGVVMEMFLPARRFCICWIVRMVGSLYRVSVEDFLPWSNGEVPCTTGITQLPIFTLCVPNVFTPEPGLGMLRGLDPKLGLSLLLGFRMVMPGFGLPDVIFAWG